MMLTRTRITALWRKPPHPPLAILNTKLHRAWPPDNGYDKGPVMAWVVAIMRIEHQKEVICANRKA